MRSVMFMAGLVAAAACGRSVVEPDRAFVAFKYDAPFCGTSLVERSLDGTVIGTDSMKPGATSTLAPTMAGNHLLGVRRIGTINGQRVSIYTWPDTTVTLKAGETATRVLPLYCS